MKPSTTPQDGSSRLRPDVAIDATGAGHVVTVGDEHHLVLLDHDQATALVASLIDAEAGSANVTLPDSGPVGEALAALVAAGWVDPVIPRIVVEGEGTLASAVRAALVRMGAHGDTGVASCALSEDDLVPTRLRVEDGLWPEDPDLDRSLTYDEARGCWVDGHHVVLSPSGVGPRDVAARRRAARLHHAAAPAVAPLPGGGVRSTRPVLAGPGLEYAAVVVAAEMVRPTASPTEAVLINLVTLTSSRHPVVAVPQAPR